MNRRLCAMGVVASIVSCAALGQTLSQSQWDAANRAVVRLDPSAFLELPANLAAELRRRGCTIPQVPLIEGRHNVVQGEFAKPGQTDWAVLCSMDRVSSILVFWNGSERNPAKLAERDDEDRFQGWGGDRIVYSSVIQPVDGPYILEHFNAYGGPKPPPIDHQGINDVFYGKASQVLYFYRGEWLHLTGAD